MRFSKDKTLMVQDGKNYAFSVRPGRGDRQSYENCKLCAVPGNGCKGFGTMCCVDDFRPDGLNGYWKKA